MLVRACALVHFKLLCRNRIAQSKVQHKNPSLQKRPSETQNTLPDAEKYKNTNHKFGPLYLTSKRRWWCVHVQWCALNCSVKTASSKLKCNIKIQASKNEHLRHRTSSPTSKNTKTPKIRLGPLYFTSNRQFCCEHVHRCTLNCSVETASPNLKCNWKIQASKNFHLRHKTPSPKRKNTKTRKLKIQSLYLTSKRRWWCVHVQWWTLDRSVKSASTNLVWKIKFLASKRLHNEHDQQEEKIQKHKK